MNNIVTSKPPCWTSLAVQWLSLHASIEGSTGSFPGWGTKITDRTVQPKKKPSLCSDQNKLHLSLNCLLIKKHLKNPTDKQTIQDTLYSYHLTQ